MKRTRTYYLITTLLIAICLSLGNHVLAQEKNSLDTVKAGMFDMGKMWTFDYPPMDYFKKTYNFSPDEKWFEEARLSALRFANYCSASFVSPDGLVMTNHHCARESGTDVQKPGENFNDNGFCAPKLSDERKVQGLYVDQLVKIEDITSLVQQYMAKDTSKAGPLTLRDNAFQQIKTDYAKKDDWKGLELQTIQFYNGGKYSLYGFKRYNDVRLVFMPELHLGFFGGDYDNFTYPRYDLDCSFFRVYDDNGKPLKTEHYFKFNTTGPVEDDAVFVVGNPGSTRRLSTISDLEFNRDVIIPIYLTLFKDRSLALQAYNKSAKNDSIVNEIFSYENSYKARKGELAGLEDPYLIARKAAFEKKFQQDLKSKPDLASQVSIWESIAQDNVQAKELFKPNFFFSPSPRITGDLLTFAYAIQYYALQMRTHPEQAANYRKRLSRLQPVKIMPIEEGYLAAYLKELSNNLGSNDAFVVKALQGKSPEEAAKSLLKTTRLNDPQVRADLLSKDTTFINQFSDPLLDLARLAVPRYMVASEKYKVIQDRLFANRSQLGNLLFRIYGTNIPPDATFSLRINDGIVKGYDYNGTIAPARTTFYGLYDRYYSFNKKYPWYLPKRWENPPAELLPIPMDFVTTNDIIGGNSGSPMINKNREVIGLVFDGNMESLPGGFIYTPDTNRAVGVTSPAILGALKYIYKAKRLEKELLGK
ncbi:MAG TPA: S46 family peptidase [Bacteroidales bacterium]